MEIFQYNGAYTFACSIASKLSSVSKDKIGSIRKSGFIEPYTIISYFNYSASKIEFSADKDVSTYLYTVFAREGRSADRGWAACMLQ